jgi:uncharacterized OB-fold protein
VTRPLPHPDRDSAPWWDALARHELLVQRCRACGAWRFPPRAICNRCASFDVEWAPISGRGTVAWWVVNHHPFSDDFTTPYAVVTVRLDEQDDVLVIGSYRGDVADIRAGLPVRAVFDDAASGVTLLSWESDVRSVESEERGAVVVEDLP